ncbi:MULTISPECIES: hypothetical protein [unclassified Enterococcus]|uniref:hypothetical protein n=1 Tax=unclassified Enterococcus TaxID=2608891 RepID=UPI001A9C152F|nr:hypothetical protein [Enterococcus sp. DIV1271a]MBO1298665.1 hypothetical protein [Enterococcus sp. DIV1271a]
MNREINEYDRFVSLNKYRRGYAKYDRYESIQLIQEVETNPKLQELLAKDGAPTKGQAALDYVFKKKERKEEKPVHSIPRITRYQQQTEGLSKGVAEIDQFNKKVRELVKPTSSILNIPKHQQWSENEEALAKEKVAVKSTLKGIAAKSTNDGKTRDDTVFSDQDSSELGLKFKKENFHLKFKKESFDRKYEYAKKYAAVVNGNSQKNKKSTISKEQR